MIKRISACLFFTSLLTCLSLSSQATHLMGGNLNYEYLGVNAGTGLYQYRVSITVYRYCASGSTTLPTSLDIGVYEDDPLNPTGDKQMVTSGVIPLITITPITPPNANDTCTFVPNVCVEEGYYEVILSFPSNSTGYYFISDRCCRNNNIINLFDPGNTGQAYYAYVPPPSIVNSSPTFAAAPVPFICASDSVSILNQAYDPDGDLLVYNFVTPYFGISDGGNPNPAPPATYPWPIPLVGYAATYSLANPFGPGGSAVIDTATGLASYYAPNQGFYVLAVEIEEWRAGVLIGVTRRDLQIIVIPCPINPPPVLGGGSTQTNYTIIEGQTLCFSSTFNDPNGDSIYISHTGDIFDPLVTNPTATFTDSSGATTATGNFCWTTSCDQGRTTPYQFSVNATDNGCPAKVTNIVYSITVVNTEAPVSISGPDTICFDQATGIQYTVPLSTGNTFDWAVSNGNITGPLNGTTITVDFTSSGIATISVVTVNANGCESDTTTKDVYIVPLPAAIAGNDVQICSGGTASLGGPATVGFTYSWNPTTGLSNATVADPTVTLTNTGTTPVVAPYIVTTNLDGCTNVDTVLVTVNPLPVASAGPDVSVCSDISITIGSANIPGQVYSWIPSTGLSDTTISDPTLTLTNTSGVTDTLIYIVQVQNGLLCSLSDTIIVYLNPAPVAEAGTDLVFCGGSGGVLGTATTPGYVYNWTPSTGLSSSTISNPTVTLNNSSGVNDTIIFVLTTGLGTCANIDSVQVIVEPSPVSNAGANQLICAGNTVQLGTTTTPGYIYSWSPATGLNDSTISDPILTLNNTGSTPDTLYYVVTTTLNSCVTTDTVQIISGPAPIANAGTDLTFCSGSGGNMGSAPSTGYSYSWNPASGLSSGTISDPTITLTNVSGANDTIDYVVTVNLFGCIDQDSVQVIVLPNPVSNAGLDQLLCSGDTIQLGTGVTSGYSYSWSPTTGLNDSTISDPILILTNPGTTQDSLTFVVTTTLNGCTTTDSVSIIVNPQPLITSSASPASICFGDSTTLNASGATTYSWALITAPQNPIGTGSSLGVIPSVTTTYIVTGTNGFSCSNEDTITVTVNPLPSVQITSATTSICVGDTLILNAIGASSYTWSIPGGAVIGTGASLQVSPSLNTTYIVAGTDSNLCSGADTINIVVNPAATANALFGNASVCPGVTGVQYYVLNPNPTSTYTWSVTNGTIVSGQGTDTIYVDWSTTPGAGMVSLIETTALGCESPVAVAFPVSVNIILTPIAPTGPVLFCANTAQGITYTTLNTPGSVYNWTAQGGTIVSGNGTSTVIVDWTAPGPQTVLLWYDETSTTVSNVCLGTSDSLAVTINPAPSTSAISGSINVCVNDSGAFSVTNTLGSTYSWIVTGASLLNGNGSNSINVNYPNTGPASINVIETNSYGCIGDTVTLPITVNALPIADAGLDVGVCTGQAVQLNASGGVAYLWTPAANLNSDTISNPLASPTASIYYSVLVTDGFGCRNSDSVFVTVNPLPVITLTPDGSVCIGNSIQLNADGGSFYQWSPASSLNDPGSPSPLASPIVNTTYTVIVTDSNGCIDSASVNITVNSLPVATASADTLICAGSSTTLSAGGGVSYSWNPASGLNNSTISNPVATPSGNTTYTVTVTDNNGCSDDAQVTITLNDQPVASFNVDNNVITANCDGVQTTLINTSQNATNYLWQFPDGTTSTETEPVYHFDFNTTQITLIAYNNICSDTNQTDYTGALLDIIFENISNVFTPNGDGMNDCFDLGANADFGDCSVISVFNRWGTKVFQSSSDKPCWNGKKDGNGEDLPSGTYYMSVHIAGHKYNGSITLLR